MNKTTKALFDPNPDVVLKALKSKHADIHAYEGNWNGQEDRYDHFYQPIHVARDPRVIRGLAAAGADLDAFTTDGESNPLLSAAARGDVEVIRTLLECGAHPNVTDAAGFTPLWKAIQHLSEPHDTVKALVAGGVDVNARDPKGNTVLHDMTVQDDIPTMRVLLDAGADVNAVNHFGNPPLFKAAANERADAVHHLINQGADIEARTSKGETPLLIATKCVAYDAIQTLLRWGAEVNTADRNGWTPLHSAARYQNADIVRELVGRGADVNARNRYKKSPLQLAISNNNEEITSRLLEAGANPNQPGKFGNVPMLYAKSNAIVERLIDHGADVNKANNYGASPLHGFIMKGMSPAAVEVLLAAGAHVNARDEEGNTPLHYVGTNHHPDDADQLVELLVKNGADPFAINHEGAYPAHPKAHLARLAAEEKALIELASAVHAASKPTQAFPSMDDAEAYVAAKRGREPAMAEGPANDVAPRPARRLI